MNEMNELLDIVGMNSMCKSPCSRRLKYALSRAIAAMMVSFKLGIPIKMLPCQFQSLLDPKLLSSDDA